jgi:hypothetical protein
LGTWITTYPFFTIQPFPECLQPVDSALNKSVFISKAEEVCTYVPTYLIKLARRREATLPWVPILPNQHSGPGKTAELSFILFFCFFLEKNRLFILLHPVCKPHNAEKEKEEKENDNVRTNHSGSELCWLHVHAYRRACN